jgi:carbamoyl-phosphate synthase large subunit
LLVETAQPAAHAAARSLARAGYRVVGTRVEARLAGRTRYCDRIHLSPPALRLDAFLERIAEVCAQERVDAILPLSDETLGALLRHGADAGVSAAVVGPSLELFERLADKRNLAALARGAGLAAPREVTVAPGEQPVELPPFPAYLKVVSGITDGDPTGRPLRVRDEAECRAHLAAADRTMLVQEEIAGEQWRFHFARRGTTIWHVAARTMSDFPPRVGQSSVSAFGPTPQPVAAAATAMLATAGYDGAGSLQMIVRDGAVYVHDANLRLPASVAGTIAAGLDLPALAVDLALGGDLRQDRVAPTRRLRFVQLPGEAAALHSAVRLRSPAKGILSAREIACAALLPRRLLEPFDLTDPIPTIAALAGAPRAAVEGRPGGR